MEVSRLRAGAISSMWASKTFKALSCHNSKTLEILKRGQIWIRADLGQVTQFIVLVPHLCLCLCLSVIQYPLVKLWILIPIAVRLLTPTRWWTRGDKMKVQVKALKLIVKLCSRPTLFQAIHSIETIWIPNQITIWSLSRTPNQLRSSQLRSSNLSRLLTLLLDDLKGCHYWVHQIWTNYFWRTRTLNGVPDLRMDKLMRKQSHRSKCLWSLALLWSMFKSLMQAWIHLAQKKKFKNRNAIRIRKLFQM